VLSHERGVFWVYSKCIVAEVSFAGPGVPKTKLSTSPDQAQPTNEIREVPAEQDLMEKRGGPNESVKKV